MCGIVGYLGKRPAVPLIVDGLRLLEYRGYDSAGIAYLEDDLLQVYKASGKLINLENALSQAPRRREDNESETPLNIGIGHIRWATHGVANETNAHPHISQGCDIALAHNGIIENFFEVKQELQAKGYEFKSETDTECVVHLLDSLLQESAQNNEQERESDFLKIIQKALSKLKGAYALTIISKKHPGKLYAVRNQAPLVIGVGEDGEYLVASDAVAIVSHTNKLIYLKDQQIAELCPEGVRLTNLQGEDLVPEVEQVNMGPLQIDKKGYKHFMLKEIHEQPDVLRNSLSGRLLSVDEPVRLLSREKDEQERIAEILKSIQRIVIVGCGTSFNAGLVGKYFIEDLVRIPVEVESAGEYRYRNPVIDENTLAIAISQSGETADTLEAIRQSKSNGAKVLTVTNREDSTIARESDIVLPVRAGVEVSVCATKSFIAQVAVLYILGIRLAEIKNSADSNLLMELKKELLRIPTLIESLLSNQDGIKAMAKKYGNARDVLFIARGINFPVALEGALKLKEISYIHAEGYSGSELKHGPIAMLDEQIPVVSVLVPGVVFEKMISNCQEAKARDARVIGFTSADLDAPEHASLHKTFEDIETMPYCHELLSPLLTTIPLQLLAYYMAEYLGKDVDQPRNLAKSVTVE